MYSKHNFIDGDVLTAKQLNEIEDGIIENENKINIKADLVDGKVPETQLPELGIKQEQVESAVNNALQAAKESGEFKGEKGDPGEDGTSVTITEVRLSESDGGHNTITFSDGKTITVKNGEKGSNGEPITHKWDGTKLIVTSASGTTSADLKGEPGLTVRYTEQNENGTKTIINFSDGSQVGVPNGKDGEDGTSVTISSSSQSTDGKYTVVTFSNGRKISIPNGADGASPKVASTTQSGGYTVVTFDNGSKVNIKNGTDGQSVTHSWKGTTLRLTSASGTTNTDLAPKIAVTEIEGGHRVQITTSDTTNTFDVMDGKDGTGGTGDLSAYLTEEKAEQTYQPKGDYLTEHQKLKTINGQSLVGEGNIVIEGGDTSAQSEYVAVKYLESNGTQYIDTGYVVQEDDTIEVDYEIPSESLSEERDKLIIDARDATSAIRVSTWGNNYKWYVRFGNASGATSTAITSSLKGVFSISKNRFILNGQVVFDNLQYTAMPTSTLTLFSGRVFDTGAMSGPAYVKISNVKIKRNNETIRNFRPVQRISDGELGMRDAVTGEFYSNAGTGIFSYAPADFVEPSAVQKKPTLTEEQKLALQSLMDDYYNNKHIFYYEFTHNRNAFTGGGTCYNSTKGKFKQCCATFVQNIMMGRSINDFLEKNASTYSAKITRTDVSDFGYYFDFKYRKYLYGLTDTDENGDTVYYGYNQPNTDNYEGSYSYNSYYHPDSTKANKQNFNGFCNANDMARELYEMGCEIPFSELDVGDIIFTLDNDLSDNSSMFNFHAWRNIYHVGMVYDVKQIDASSKEIYYIECTSYFDVDNRPIEKPFLSSSEMDLRFKAFKLTEDMAFCARMPVAFGYEPNVPTQITKSAEP